VSTGVPTNLTAAATSYSSISLAWADNSSNESGWEVHRSTAGGANGTSYHVTGLTLGESYSYVVVALKDGGQSDPSAVVSAIAP
jgi:titin